MQSDGKVYSPATRQIFHLDCDCDRRAGRGTRFGDPVCPWAICIEDPKVKIFVTGRPEPRIRKGFRLPLLARVTDMFVLHDAEPRRVNIDIRLFLKDRFSELADRRGGLDGWPMLCERAAGLFVYAVATVSFIDRGNNSPKRRLDRLPGSPESN